METQRKFRTLYNIKVGDFPNRKLVTRTVRRFKGSGSINPSVIRPRAHTMSTEENIERVRESVSPSPQTSIWRRSQHLGIP